MLSALLSEWRGFYPSLYILYILYVLYILVCVHSVVHPVVHSVVPLLYHWLSRKSGKCYNLQWLSLSHVLSVLWLSFHQILTEKEICLLSFYSIPIYPISKEYFGKLSRVLPLKPYPYTGTFRLCGWPAESSQSTPAP